MLLIGLACAGHQGFSANLFSMPADLFPRWAVGSVVGSGRIRGSTGGMLMAKYAGWVLETFGSYTPIFVIAGSAYLVALLVVHLINPRYDAGHQIRGLRLQRELAGHWNARSAPAATVSG